MAGLSWPREVFFFLLGSKMRLLVGDVEGGLHLFGVIDEAWREGGGRRELSL